MSDLYLIDTHTLIWYLTADGRLGASAKTILHDQTTRLLLPAIALAEAFFILEKRPTLYKMSPGDLLQKVTRDFRITIVALDQVTLTKTLECMVIPEMHDRQIVATALLAQTPETQVAILTRDENIQNCGLVQTIW